MNSCGDSKWANYLHLSQRHCREVWLRLILLLFCLWPYLGLGELALCSLHRATLPSFSLLSSSSLSPASTFPLLIHPSILHSLFGKVILSESNNNHVKPMTQSMPMQLAWCTKIEHLLHAICFDSLSRLFGHQPTPVSPLVCACGILPTPISSDSKGNDLRHLK